MDIDGHKKIVPGLILAVSIGAASWLTSLTHIAVSPLVVGIIAGMIVRTVIGERPSLKPGLEKSVNTLIPIGIILYGTNLEFHRLVEIPTQIWLQILVGISVVVLAVYTFGPKLKINKALSLLVGVGTAICGASAIVIAAPVVDAKSDDTAKAILTITVMGLIGVILWPFAGDWLGLSTDSYAQFCATTLQQTGLVKTAAAARGPACLTTAMTIKMARIASIIPLILVIGILSKFKSADEAAKSRESLDIHIPWFLWGFIVVGLAFSYIDPLAKASPYIRPLAGLAWTMAMTSVGLSVDLRRVVGMLGRPLFLGLIAWIVMIAVFLVGTI